MASRENQLGGVASPLDLGVALVSGSTAHSGEDALSALVSLVEADLEACNRVIVAADGQPGRADPAARGPYRRGRRQAPAAAADARRGPAVRLSRTDGGGARHVDLAACVEFIHTATLLHDDVVDESQLRRGLASANAVFGNKASVLVGDFLFARAFQLMVDDGSLRVLAILSKAAATIAEGEVLQLVTQNDLSTTEARYLEVIQGKTAALFAAACQIGAVVADRPEREEAALAEYGMKLGIAFQLVDDALDYVADQATLGKTIGDDFREGKITLPVLAAFLAGDELEKAFWRRTIEALEQTDADLDHAMRLIADHGAIRVTLGSRAALRAGGEGRPDGVSRQPDPAGARRCRRLHRAAAALKFRRLARSREMICVAFRRTDSRRSRQACRGNVALTACGTVPQAESRSRNQWRNESSIEASRPAGTARGRPIAPSARGAAGQLPETAIVQITGTDRDGDALARPVDWDRAAGAAADDPDASGTARARRRLRRASGCWRG